VRVCVVGSGGREHALAQVLGRSAEVVVTPGNPGIPESVSEPPEEIEADLFVIGPEAPLVDGLADRLRHRGRLVFGPGTDGARLEGSKAWMKEVLVEAGVPTARYGTFTDRAAAQAFLDRLDGLFVVKTDGLAAGKGVIVAQTEQEAIDAVNDMLAGNTFGDAGRCVVIEEFLSGEEASFIVMVDGKHVLPLATSQDHKPRDNGDKGPNTGGMGAYSPAPVITPQLHKIIMERVIYPTVHGLAAEGTPYTGFLYAGVMISADGTPRVLEYNCRFGDPETQPVMMRLRSDLVTLCNKALDGQLHQTTVEWDPRPALGVVMAAGGYPENYNKGDIISGLPGDLAALKVFHAGTTEKNGDIVTNGGRVLCVTALGQTIAEAQQDAYKTVNNIHWNNMYYRTDIGYRAISII